MYVDGKEPHVLNISAPNILKIGDYVFASKWGDCDPCDPWAVGFVTEVGKNYVVIGDVSSRRWLKARIITSDQGERILKHYPELEVGRTSDYNVIKILWE